MFGVLLVLGLASAEAPAPVEFGVIPEEVAEIARAVANQPLAQRMKAVSEPFMGLPYEIDGHGEGSGPDPDRPPATILLTV